MGAVRYKAHAVIGFLNGFFHRPVYFFDVVVCRNGVQSSEHLRIVHDVAGVEEGYTVFKPLFAVLRAEILRVVLLADIEYKLFLGGNDLGVSLNGEVHE